MTAAVFDRRMVDLDHAPGLERDLALLGLRLRHGEINKLSYDKQRATLHETPWIGIVDQGFDLEKGVNGVFFEFDWNGFWIDYLRLHGYVGQDVRRLLLQERAAAQPEAAQGGGGLRRARIGRDRRHPGGLADRGCGAGPYRGPPGRDRAGGAGDDHGAAILLIVTLGLYGVWRTTASVTLLLLSGLVLASVYVGYGVMPASATATSTCSAFSAA